MNDGLEKTGSSAENDTSMLSPRLAPELSASSGPPKIPAGQKRETSARGRVLATCTPRAIVQLLWPG